MTRSGQLAKQDDCDSFDRLRFVAPKYDKTIIKVEPPQADNIQMGSILCLYLFNDRSLSRPVEKLE